MSNKDLSLTSAFDQIGTECLNFLLYPDTEISSTPFSLKLPFFWSVTRPIISCQMGGHLDTPRVSPIQAFAAA